VAGCQRNTFDVGSDIHDYLNSEDDTWFSMNKIEVTVEVIPNISGYFERRSIMPQQKNHQQNAGREVNHDDANCPSGSAFSTLRFWLPNVRIASCVLKLAHW
jgi:hypothetical protein